MVTGHTQQRGVLVEVDATGKQKQPQCEFRGYFTGSCGHEIMKGSLPNNFNGKKLKS